MIYTAFGSTVEIVADHGDHLPSPRSPAVSPLLTVRFLDDGRERYRFQHTLRADNGVSEIIYAVANVREVKLEGRDLFEAIRDAQ